MRRVDRGQVAVPASLMAGSAGDRELVRLKAYRALPARTADGKKRKPFTYSAYKLDDVQEALTALFHGKCAYCETNYAASSSGDVDHFRPKGRVAEDPGHGGYWWIAMRWENLLPSCNDCNRERRQVLIDISPSLATLSSTAVRTRAKSGKHDSFPLAATGTRAVAEAEDFSGEHPLLLNPCADDPAESLAYVFDPTHPAGLLTTAGDAGQQVRGAASIQVFGLNRSGLVEDRTRLLRELEFLGDTLIDLAEIGEGEEWARLRARRDECMARLRELRNETLPYSSMVAAWFEAFKQRFAPATPAAQPGP